MNENVKSARAHDSNERALSDGSTPDLICMSHLRWDFVYQRPQHLMTRFARERRVFFVEEPMFDDTPMPRLDVSQRETKLLVAAPHLPRDTARDEVEQSMRQLIDQMLLDHDISDFVLWYYTPMALGFTNHLQPLATVYDCMDELSAFRGAPQELRDREQELFRRSSLVFTGGQSLYEAKKGKHPNVYAFPSSIDFAHFAQARHANEPEDQASIPHPRIGFFGVLDERLDTALLAGIADARPDWQIVMIGPVVKIDPEDLPKRENIHYFGGRAYADLPRYLAGWDVATLLFARNESTRFISPTKTPEYLAAGRPVVSTSIRDVVSPYGDEGLVLIADDVPDFVAAIEQLLAERNGRQWLERVDTMLARTSWDQTWITMSGLIDSAMSSRAARNGVASAPDPKATRA